MGRDLSNSVKAQVQSNKNESKPSVTARVKNAKTKEGQKKEGKSVSLKHVNIEMLEEFLRESNYENKGSVSFSEALDTLIETFIDFPEFKKQIIKKS